VAIEEADMNTAARDYIQWILGEIQDNHPEVRAIYIAQEDDGAGIVLQVILNEGEEHEPLEDYLTVGPGQSDLIAEVYFEAGRLLGTEYDMTVLPTHVI
jgi:hypothetical protein